MSSRPGFEGEADDPASLGVGVGPRPGFSHQLRETDGGVQTQPEPETLQASPEPAESGRERLERARRQQSASSSLLDDPVIQHAIIGGASGLVAGTIGSTVAGVDPTGPALVGTLLGAGAGAVVAELEVGA